MTTSTLNYAAQSADAGLEHERQKLADLRNEETNLGTDLDRAQQYIRETTDKLAVKGKEAHMQEQRVAEIEKRMRDHAEALLRDMAHYGMEAQPVPALVANTVEDPLGLGEVPVTEQPTAYIDQVNENGAPPIGLTQPVPSVFFEGDPNARVDLGEKGEVPVAPSPTKRGARR